MTHATIADLLHHRALSQPEAPAILFLERGERPGGSDTYGTLDLAARRIAAQLLAMGLSGRAVLLACDTGLPFVRAFLGCLYAGTYPVPVPPLARRERGERLRHIIRDAAPAAMIVESRGRSLAQEATDLPILVVDEALPEIPALERPEAVAPQDIAFIQYTSGSTMAPRGIAVTHGNIMANQAMIQQAFGHDASTVVMSWLPLHHDMGLIGSILQPLYLGGRCILASPLAFLQRPVRWLRAISEYRATTSGAPNFAFDLCVRQIPEKELAGLDLSSWTLAFCGSEPVRPGTMQRFAARFAPAGFDPAALYPCYGMAEATLFISGGAPGQGARSVILPRSGFADVSAHADAAQPVTNCGAATAPGRVAILAPETARPLGENVVGEVCVAGPHVSPGLWAPDCAGRIRPHDGRMVMLDGTPYLRSGDMGMMIQGELHVVGRIKDMIIVRGANIYAEDIEHALLEQPEAADLVAAAAVAVERDEAEMLVLLCELSTGARAGLPVTIAETLRRRVAEAVGLMPGEMVLLPPRSLPRTTSGKIQRGRARAAWLDGQLAPSRWLPA
ncbi:fatty acyl-AMP ligase [Sediminicoccus rosea]|uniref:Fatty acyl-AMP ligase n=1 Tax=Sediminicoccus rosea TaxID=1225128 RepID=A0ABZ0PP66_9PROT|nr:fatty acyl-AMP ligase [Sediminicoccus rosea]WPB86905.1 fatty acyl-AMP ligase [Sediminicoccus rosea]